MFFYLNRVTDWWPDLKVINLIRRSKMLREKRLPFTHIWLWASFYHNSRTEQWCWHWVIALVKIFKANLLLPERHHPLLLSLRTPDRSQSRTTAKRLTHGRSRCSHHHKSANRKWNFRPVGENITVQLKPICVCWLPCLLSFSITVRARESGYLFRSALIFFRPSLTSTTQHSGLFTNSFFSSLVFTCPKIKVNYSRQI